MSFLGQMLRHPKEVGRISPTSGLVVRAMLATIDFSKAYTVVELGGGTGAITKRILKKLRKNARLFVLENNPVFVHELQQIDDDRLEVIDGSAHELGIELWRRHIERVDAFVSSLPMVIMPHALVEGVLSQAFTLLHKDGLFVQLHHTPFMKSTYQQTFKDVHVAFMPFSLPPAFIMVCRKNRQRKIQSVPTLQKRRQVPVLRPSRGRRMW